MTSLEYLPDKMDLTVTVAKKGAKYFYVRYTAKSMRIAKRRRDEQSAAFRQKYRWRAGVEATMSQYDKLTGVKRLPLRGRLAVRFAAEMKAIAINIARAVAVNIARTRLNSPGAAFSPIIGSVLQVFKGRIYHFWRYVSWHRVVKGPIVPICS